MSGIDGSIFEGMTLDLDEGLHGFDVMEPDLLDTLSGSQPCLTYLAGTGFGGVQYAGKVEGGTAARARSFARISAGNGLSGGCPGFGAGKSAGLFFNLDLFPFQRN